MDGIAILLVIAVAYALLAVPLDRLSVSAPMVFVVAGPCSAPVLPACSTCRWTVTSSSPSRS